MTDNEKKVLKAFYQAVCDGPGMMDRVTSKKLGMELEEFREIVNDFIDYGFLPGHYSVRGGRGNEKGWDSQGNQLSQEARRKANFRKTLNLMLTAEIDSEEWKPVLESLGVECTLESALLMAQIKEALSGNTQAATFVAKYAGQSPEPDENRRNREADTELKRANADKLNRDCSSEDETEGVEIINDADKETG